MSRTVTRPRADNVIIPLVSHSFPVLVSLSLQVSLPASQPTDLAAGGSPVESLQSHFILTMSYWSSGLPVCFPSQGIRVQIPLGVLMLNRDSPVSDVLLQVIFFNSMVSLYNSKGIPYGS